MNNREIQAAWKYHDGTKHSYWSIRNHPHFLDWANRPQLFKIYPKIEPLPLPRDVSHTGVAALSAISEPAPSSRADSVPDLQELARILCFSAGVTKQRAHPGGEIYFRAAACTGALYEIELYVVTGDLAGLDAGVYHFNPADVSLRLLRKGDFRANLAQGTAMEPARRYSCTLSRNNLSLPEREGWRSLRRALASIWRMRSRVTANARPTSSSVCSESSSRPKRIFMIFSSRAVRVCSTCPVCSFRFTLMAASSGASAALSLMKSPRWESPSSPIGVSSEIGTCMILRTLRSLAAGMSMRLAISNEVGSRPNSWTSCRDTRISLTSSTMCTDSRMVRA